MSKATKATLSRADIFQTVPLTLHYFNPRLPVTVAPAATAKSAPSGWPPSFLLLRCVAILATCTCLPTFMCECTVLNCSLLQGCFLHSCSPPRLFLLARLQIKFVHHTFSLKFIFVNSGIANQSWSLPLLRFVPEQEQIPEVTDRFVWFSKWPLHNPARSSRAVRNESCNST